MVTINTLREGYQRFYQKYFIQKPEIYKNLVEEGQNPRTLVIACSDSRADPAILLDTKPGDLFVVRNVASLVPPYQPDQQTYHGTSAALEFGVCHLKVENIVVIGHSDCAGIQALDVDPLPNSDFIKPWVQQAAEACQKGGCQTHALPIRIQKSVQLSLNNLQTFPWIQQRIASGKLQTHGWYFDMTTGKLIDVEKEEKGSVASLDE